MTDMTPTPSDVLRLELIAFSALAGSAQSPDGRATYWEATGAAADARAQVEGDPRYAAYAEACAAYAVEVRRTQRMDLPSPVRPDDTAGQPVAAPAVPVAGGWESALDLLGDGLDDEQHKAEMREAEQRIRRDHSE